MSKYTSNVNFEFDFDGDRVVFSLKRLKVKHMAILSPYIKDHQLTFTEQLDMLNASSRVLPDCVESMSGLVDSNGVQLTILNIADEIYFMPLLSAVLGKLFEISLLSVDESKKSISLPQE